MSKTIMILCYSDLRRDPRVYRQIIMLKDHYKIIAVGLADPCVDGVDFINLTSPAPLTTSQTSNNLENNVKVSGVRKNLKNKMVQYMKKVPWLKSPLKFVYSILVKLKYFIYLIKNKIYVIKYLCKNLILLKFGLFNQYYWSKAQKTAYSILNGITFDLILANDIHALPLSVRLAKNIGAKLIYDAHEYTPLELEDSFKWRFKYKKYYTYLCAQYMPQADVIFTVCDGIAAEYNKNFSVHPIVITNAPEFEKLHPHPINEEKIKMIHHGAAIPARKLELMLDTMKYVDNRFTLDLMLMPNYPKYFLWLKNYAKDMENVRFLEPVEMPKISSFINQYDIGLCMVPPTNFNYKYGLGNKFFEFIQGRLMLAIGPLIEMKKIVNKFKLGLVTDSFSPKQMAKELNKITSEQIWQYKTNSHKNAFELSFDANQIKVLELVNLLLKVKNV